MLNNFDIRPLATAIMKQAIIDAKNGTADLRHEAREWLIENASWYLSALNVEVDQDYIVRWVKRGCKTNGIKLFSHR